MRFAYSCAGSDDLVTFRLTYSGVNGVLPLNLTRWCFVRAAVRMTVERRAKNAYIDGWQIGIHGSGIASRFTADLVAR